MSFNKLDDLYDELQNVINDGQSDVTKFIEGNNSAGTRVRKAMQTIKFKIKRTDSFNCVIK